MPIPAAIQTVTVVWHAAEAFIDGTDTTTAVTVTPSSTVIWQATGTPLAAFTSTHTGAQGADVSFQLPYVDQPGFVDQAGNAITGWTYTARVSITSVSDGQALQITKTFQVYTGQTGPLDLALMPGGTPGAPTVTAISTVTSVAGLTGAVTGAQIAADPAVMAAIAAFAIAL